MSDTKAAKLAAARKKLKDYQEKKNIKSTGLGNEVSSERPEQLYDDNTMTIETRNQGADTDTFNESQNVILHESINDYHSNDFNQVQYSPQYKSGQNQNLYQQQSYNHMKATEILVAEKQNLEAKIMSLEQSFEQLKQVHMQTNSDLDFARINVIKMEKDLRDAKENIKYLQNELDNTRSAVEFSKLNENKLGAVKSELEERLDEAVSELKMRKTENCSLLSQLTQMQRELEMTQLRLQQLTNGAVDAENSKRNLEELDSNALLQQNGILQNKIASFEQQIKVMLNEKEQVENHYQHYIRQLNEQIETTLGQNRTKDIEIESLSNREASLIDQISQMEIRIQALQNHISVIEKTNEHVPDSASAELKELQIQHEVTKTQLLSLEKEYELVRRQLSESENKMIELKEKIEMLEKDQPDIAKLMAANESDRVAAQRATAQNAKLKEELQGLQDGYFVMNNDKLELTEKLQAEKFLNRELTIKLSESEALLKDVQSKLKAKDEEMIRLQSHCSQLEKECLQYSQEIDRLRHYEVTQSNEGVLCEKLKQAEKQISKLTNELNSLKISQENGENNCDAIIENVVKQTEKLDQTENETEVKAMTNNNLNDIRTEEAMMKLQERFLKTMSQLAELSDEKQNLEHIVLQLQGETETICEYIALYQQQRGILKQREEERAAQLRYMAAERERMQKQLEELQKLITETQNTNSSQSNPNFRNETVGKMVHLLSEIKQSHLVDPHQQCPNFENFHPCPWCSGKLINV